MKWQRSEQLNRSHSLRWQFLAAVRDKIPRRVTSDYHVISNRQDAATHSHPPVKSHNQNANGRQE